MTEDQKDELKIAVRLAVAESRLDSHAQMIENNQELTAKIVDRMDTHIRDQGHQVQESTRVIDECRGAIVELKTAVDTFISTSTAFLKVGVKIIAGAALVISGIWAVYVFYVGSNTTTTTTTTSTQVEKK